MHWILLDTQFNRIIYEFFLHCIIIDSERYFRSKLWPFYSFLEEQEFLGELAEVGHDDSLFKRDHVFVKLNFKLKSGKLQVEITNLIGSKMVLSSAPFIFVELSVSNGSIVNMVLFSTYGMNYSGT